MKKLFIALASAALLFAAAACQNLDEIKSDIEDLQTEVSALQTLMNKVNSNVYVSEVVSDTENGSYTIKFTDQTSVTIKDGDSFFASVEIQASYVVLTLNDENNTVVKLPLKNDSAVAGLGDIVYIPEYSDGMATIRYYEASDASISLDFMLGTAAEAKAVAKSFKSGDVTVKATVIEVETRAGAGDILAELDAPAIVTSFDNILSFKGIDASGIVDKSAAMQICLKVSDSYATRILGPIALAKQQLGTSISYKGDSYKIVKMKDGRVWMADDLRYIPKGKTPSDKTDLAAIQNGLWYPVDIATKNLVKPSASEGWGYLYTAATAFGIADETNLNETNYSDFEGCQGICPNGWHIPTGAEIFKLAGRVSSWPGSPTGTSEDKSSPSPYYDGDATTLGNCKMALLNADGFNISNQGTVSVVGTAKTSGSILNTMSYELGSTAYTVEMGFTSLMKDGALNNIQYFSFMPMKANQTANGATANYRSGFLVRCIKD